MNKAAHLIANPYGRGGCRCSVRLKSLNHQGLWLARLESQVPGAGRHIQVKQKLVGIKVKLLGKRSHSLWVAKNITLEIDESYIMFGCLSGHCASIPILTQFI